MGGSRSLPYECKYTKVKIVVSFEGPLRELFRAMSKGSPMGGREKEPPGSVPSLCALARFLSPFIFLAPATQTTGLLLACSAASVLFLLQVINISHFALCLFCFRFLSVESGLKYLSYRGYLTTLIEQWRSVIQIHVSVEESILCIKTYFRAKLTIRFRLLQLLWKENLGLSRMELLTHQDFYLRSSLRTKSSLKLLNDSFE